MCIRSIEFDIKDKKYPDLITSLSVSGNSDTSITKITLKDDVTHINTELDKDILYQLYMFLGDIYGRINKKESE